MEKLSYSILYVHKPFVAYFPDTVTSVKCNQNNAVLFVRVCVCVWRVYPVNEEVQLFLLLLIARCVAHSVGGASSKQMASSSAWIKSLKPSQEGKYL